MHLRLVVVAVAIAAPVALGAAQNGALRPLTAVQIEGGGRPAPQAPPGAAVPEAQAPAPLAPVPVTRLDASQLHPALDRPITLEFFKGPQPVRALMEFIAEEMGVSLVMDAAIEAQFNGQLRDVTMGEALDLITEQANLDWSLRGNVLRVFAREPETRLYAIDYVITQRNGSRSLSASAGAGGGATGGGGAGGAGAVGGGGGAGGAGSAGLAGGSAQVGGVDAPNFFEALEEGVRSLLSPDGLFNLDRTAGVLQVTDRAGRLDRIEQYLETVLLRATRQVMIEARVVEIEMRDQFQAGVNWNAIFRRAGNALSIGQTLAPGGIFTLSGSLDDNFTVLATLFQQQGKVNVLSSPRVAAMNNQTALIQAGTQQVYFTSTFQRDAQGLITQTTETPQAVTVGVVLSVTPQISADGIIHMSLNPTITDLASTVTSPSGSSVPVVNTRATDTLVRVREGETIVLGGLMQNRSNATTTKVPLLGDIPGIGYFFKRTETSTTKTDLVIMLTPTLMGPADVNETTAREIRRLDGAQRVMGKAR